MIKDTTYLLATAFCLLLQCALGQCPENCDCSTDIDVKKVKCQNIQTDALETIPSDTTDLHLNANDLQEIHPEDLPYLGGLRKLYLLNCNLRAFSVLAENLPNIEVLQISENTLSSVPNGLPPSLKTLYLSKNVIVESKADDFVGLDNIVEIYLDHNHIRQVANTSFFVRELSPSRTLPPKEILLQLRKLVLSSNQITSIEDYSFENLKLLYALKLSKNKISEIHSKTFSGLRNLQYLDLDRNKIVSVEDNAFSHFSNLKELTLKHNRLTTIPRGLPMMEWLDLSFNHIAHVSFDLRPEFYAIEMLNLGRNPFYCDCNLVWLKEFYDRREYQVKHLKDIDKHDFIPSCASPAKISGESWEFLADDVFVCDSTSVPEHRNSDTKSQFDPASLKVTLGDVGDTAVRIDWSVQGTPPSPTIIIQYYIFGNRANTIKYIEISVILRGYSVKHLEPQTNYIFCVILKLPGNEANMENLSPLSMAHCLEVTTRQQEKTQMLSYFYVFCYYVLTSASTIIFILLFIGCVAMLACAFMKNECSTRVVSIDEPIGEGCELEAEESRSPEPDGTGLKKPRDKKDD